MVTNDSLTIIRIFLINNFEKLPNGLRKSSMFQYEKISFRYVLGKWAISELPSTSLSKSVIVRNHSYENVPNTG